MANWNDVLSEITALRANPDPVVASAAVDTVRRKYLKALNKYTGRNVIAYYSGWLSKPDVFQADINDEDKNGFMTAVHRLKRKQGLDLLIHTPGGNMGSPTPPCARCQLSDL